MLSIIVRIPILNSQCIYFVHSKMIRNAHRLLNSMAVGLGRGAPSIELARLIGIPSPLPSPHSSVVGRGNRPAAWWWCQDTPQALLGPTWRLHSAREQFILIVRFVRGAPSRVNDAVVAHERFA